MLDQYAQALKDRAENKTLRRLRANTPGATATLEINGVRMVNFSSNDYLGLSQHDALKSRAIEYINKYGTGSGASRLLSGNIDAFEKIENKLAKLKGTEAALILPSGFQTNTTVLPALLKKTSQVAADRLVHRSLIEGLSLSSARWFRFKHNDYAQLQSRFLNKAELQENENDSNAGEVQDNRNTNWLVSESIFSMDGDSCHLDEAIEVARKLNLALYIDEAHATGVLGKNGMGLTAGVNFNGVSMGTFGKGLGSFGAYICCSSTVREYLINFCSGLVYSTALPPAVLGAIDAALDLVPEMDRERDILMTNAEYLRSSLRQLGFEIGKSSSQIIPIILGNEDAALLLSKYLEEHGFYVPAIRPPTVATGSSRLRLSLSASHTRTQIDELLNLLRSWHEKES